MAVKLRNPRVPEGINVSRHSAVRDLFLLTGGLLAFVAILGIALFWFGGVIMRQLPVRWENALADAVVVRAVDAPETAEARTITAELQALADRLSPSMVADEETRIQVHYLDSDIINAFATLGGHVFIARGLIERMPNENALAMVMAHEIGHVVERHPASATGGGLLVTALWSLIFGGSPDGLSALVTGPDALLVTGFSRAAEREADLRALDALARTYGHVGGADHIFTVFRDELAAMPLPPQILSTHPLSADRIAAVAIGAAQAGWPTTGPITPLSPQLAAVAGR